MHLRVMVFPQQRMEELGVPHKSYLTFLGYYYNDSENIIITNNQISLKVPSV